MGRGIVLPDSSQQGRECRRRQQVIVRSSYEHSVRRDFVSCPVRDFSFQAFGLRGSTSARSYLDWVATTAYVDQDCSG